MRFTCPSCAKSYRLPPERLGAAGRAQVSCPNCKAVVLVRAVEGDVLECKLITGQDAVPSAGVSAAATSSGVVAAAPARQSASAAQHAGTALPVWFVVIGRDKQGPMTVAQLGDLMRAGTITAVSLVWQKGLVSWTKLQDVPDLAGLVHAESAPPPQPAAAARLSQPIAPQPVARVSQPIAPQPVAQPARQPAPQQVQPAAAEPAQPLQRPSQPVAQPVAQPQVQAQPRPMPQAAARPAQAQAPQPQAARQTGQNNRPVAQPQGLQRAPQPSPRPAPKPPMDLDDSGPTMETDLPLLTKGLRAAAPEFKPSGLRKDASAVQADAHGANFFSTGHDLHDVELLLPDPNRHKPTKEEYQNLLQEFSVMFRLDKRSKRQKILIGVIASVLVVGVIVFGTLLYVNGNNKRTLINESRAILAVFALPYQSTELVPQEKEDAADPSKPNAKAVEPAQVEVSGLAAQLIKARRASPKRVAKKAEQSTGVKLAGAIPDLPVQRKLSAEEEEARRRAMEGPGGKVEASHTTTASATKVSTSDLNKFCNGRVPGLRPCLGPGGGSFKVRFTVDGDGDVTDVKAFEGGKADDSLSACAKPKMKGRFGPQPGGQSTEHTCSVD